MEVTPEVIVCDALMAIPLTAGEHVIELTFFPAGLGAGLVCTACGIIVFVSLILISMKLKAPVRLTAALQSGKAAVQAEEETEETQNKYGGADDTDNADNSDNSDNNG